MHHSTVGLHGQRERRGSLKQGWVPALPSPDVLKPSHRSTAHMPETGTHDAFLVTKRSHAASTQEPFLTPKGKPLPQFLSAQTHFAIAHSVTGVRGRPACSTNSVPQRVSFLCPASFVHRDLGDSSLTLGAAEQFTPGLPRALGGQGPHVSIWPRAGRHPGAPVWGPPCAPLQGICVCVSLDDQGQASRGEHPVCLACTCSSPVSGPAPALRGSL